MANRQPGMRCLIDTHALIWWWDKDDHLTERVRVVMTDRENELFVSAVVGWEVATKVKAGRLPTMVERIRHYDKCVTEDGFRHLAVRPDHGVAGGLLEGKHRDPFDRLLAAQALIEGLTVITRDREIAAFGCEVLW